MNGITAKQQLIEEITKSTDISPATCQQLLNWLKRDDVRYVTKAILTLIAAGAFVSVAVVAPVGISGLAMLLKPLVPDDNRRRRLMRKLKPPPKSPTNELVQIRFDNQDRLTLSLTKKGKKMAMVAHAEALNIDKPSKWDKQWRVVIFDIAEKYRAFREVLRRKLKQLGFRNIQQSVWIIPWPCEAELQLFRERYGLKEAVIIMTVPDGKEFEPYRKTFFKK